MMTLPQLNVIGYLSDLAIMLHYVLTLPYKKKKKLVKPDSLKYGV